MESDFKILLFQRIIPNYRVSIFERLCKEINLTVCFSNEKKGSSLKNSRTINFPVIKLKRIFFSKSNTFLIQLALLKVLLKTRPKVVISEGAISYLTMWLLFIFKPIFKYKLIIWSHGIKNGEIEKPFINFEGKLRLNFLNWADAILIYSQERKQLLQKFIKNDKKIFVANNTLDTIKLGKLFSKFETIGKTQIKKELNLDTDFNFIFIGRLLSQKKIDSLIASFLKKDLKMNLLIIGDGPEKSKLQKMASNSSKVKFLGEIFDNEITGKYLYASDLMICPSNIGLSLIHSFAFGCPVLTYDEGSYSKHGPEFEYLKNGYNGIILKNAETLDFEKLVDSNLNNLGENARKTIETEASIENFIQGFKNAIAYSVSL